MADILILKEAEKMVESVASRFVTENADFEDLIQVGRITVWKLLKNYRITPKNVGSYEKFIRESVLRALVDEFGNFRAPKPLTEEEDDQALLEEILFTKTGRNLDVNNNRGRAMALLKKLASESLKTRVLKTRRAVVRWLARILNLKQKEIPRKINYQVFVEHGLQRWLWVFFNNSPFRAINFSYPGEFLRYEMRAPQRYWSGNGGRGRAVEALRLALRETGCSPEQYPKLMTDRFINEFRLGCPMHTLFDWNRFKYLNEAFPGQYRPWEFSITPRHFFDFPENVKEAVRWLVEKKLGILMETLTVDEIWDQRVTGKVTKDVFCDYGLREIMAIHKSPEPALRLTYPGKFLPWSFKKRGKWMGKKGKELAACATRWLIEEHFKISPSSAMIDCEFFRQNGLWGMLTAKSLGFNTSPRRALENAYPHLATPASFGTGI